MLHLLAFVCSSPLWCGLACANSGQIRPIHTCPPAPLLPHTCLHLLELTHCCLHLFAPNCIHFQLLGLACIHSGSVRIQVGLSGLISHWRSSFVLSFLLPSPQLRPALIPTPVCTPYCPHSWCCCCCCCCCVSCCHRCCLTYMHPPCHQCCCCCICSSVAVSPNATIVAYLCPASCWPLGSCVLACACLSSVCGHLICKKYYYYFNNDLCLPLYDWGSIYL